MNRQPSNNICALSKDVSLVIFQVLRSLCCP